MRNKYDIGCLLTTLTTKKWSDSEFYRAQSEEARRVFSGFNPRNQGESRKFICECPDIETARLVARALNHYDEHREQIYKCEVPLRTCIKCNSSRLQKVVHTSGRYRDSIQCLSCGNVETE